MSEKIFPDTLLTTAGRQMIVDSQGGSTLTFTRVALGDGVLAQGQDQSALTAIISEKLSANISSYTDNEDGTFSLIFSVNNSTLDVGFMHREIGIMAKVDDGEEQLYAYTNAGTAATFLYDKTTPIQERVVRIDFVVGSAENLSVEIDGSVVYPTRGEVQQMIGTHNTGSDSHADLLHLRKPSTVYAVGDIAYSALLPSWAYLECTVGGTTDSGDLPVPSSVVVNATFTDGTVTWAVRKIENMANYTTTVNSPMFNKRDTITTSGTYTAPVTGWYKITVKGGGGGGSGSINSGGIYSAGGGGGGEGGTTIAYEHMNAGDTATVVIGAGGTGGNANGVGGTDGGDSSVTVGGNAYAAGGGKKSTTRESTGSGGTGTIIGCSGGGSAMGYESYSFGGAGGGAGGGCSRENSVGADGVQGGGGAGGSGYQSTNHNGGNGGDGYVWFEYFDSSLNP